MCACRHEAAHLGKACHAPVDVCMSLGGAAEWIVYVRARLEAGFFIY